MLNPYDSTKPEGEPKEDKSRGLSLEPKDFTDFGPVNLEKARLLHAQQIHIAFAEGSCQALGLGEFEQSLDVKLEVSDEFE